MSKQTHKICRNDRKCQAFVKNQCPFAHPYQMFDRIHRNLEIAVIEQEDNQLQNTVTRQSLKENQQLIKTTKILPEGLPITPGEEIRRCNNSSVVNQKGAAKLNHEKIKKLKNDIMSTLAQKGGRKVCKYGTECHSKKCSFEHPEGNKFDRKRKSSVVSHSTTCSSSSYDSKTVPYCKFDQICKSETCPRKHSTFNGKSKPFNLKMELNEAAMRNQAMQQQMPFQGVQHQQQQLNYNFGNQQQNQGVYGFIQQPLQYQQPQLYQQPVNTINGFVNSSLLQNQMIIQGQMPYNPSYMMYNGFNQYNQQPY
eukprot:403359279